MTNIRIEEVGDVNSKYNYLEVFLTGSNSPFLDVSVSDSKTLVFKFYSSTNDLVLSAEDYERILIVAKRFLPKTIKNEEDYEKLNS